MKKTVIILMLAALSLAACSKGGVKQRNEHDSLSYVIGMNVAANLLKMDSTLNVDVLCEAIRNTYDGSTKMSMDEARAFYLRYINYSEPEKRRLYEEQFLADMAKSDRTLTRTESGVTYNIAVIGDEKSTPRYDDDVVKIRYKVFSADGTELYSSYARKDTISIALQSLRSGMRESVKMIGKGGKITAWIPSKLDYGQTGNDSLGVKPFQTLRYQIELVGVGKLTPSERRRLEVNNF